MKYSHSPEIQRAAEDLIREGWRAEKGAKHWKLFTPDGKLRIAVPGTPSDHRSYLNWLRDVRRIKRGQKIGERDMEYNAKPMTDVSQFRNEPRVIADAVRSDYQTPQSVEKADRDRRPFNGAAFELAKRLIELEGKRYEEVAEILNAQGFTTIFGANLNKMSLGDYMRRFGYRQRSFRKDKIRFRGYEKLQKEQKEKTAEASELTGKKKFDKEAFEIARKMRREGYSYAKTADYLRSLGYTTATGRVLHGTRLQPIMLRKERQEMNLKQDSVPETKIPLKEEVRAEARQQEGILYEVEELISSNLNSVSKEKHLLMLAREWSQKGILK